MMSPVYLATPLAVSTTRTLSSPAHLGISESEMMFAQTAKEHHEDTLRNRAHP
jgi:hypothetical protein